MFSVLDVLRLFPIEGKLKLLINERNTSVLPPKYSLQNTIFLYINHLSVLHASDGNNGAHIESEFFMRDVC